LPVPCGSSPPHRRIPRGSPRRVSMPAVSRRAGRRSKRCRLSAVPWGAMLRKDGSTYAARVCFGHSVVAQDAGIGSVPQGHLGCVSGHGVGSCGAESGKRARLLLRDYTSHNGGELGAVQGGKRANKNTI
jgi:hypothetical protein